MAGLSQAAQQTALDAVFPTSGGTDYIAWSEDGSTESAHLARTAIGATGWAAATAATPSVKANNTALTTAAASGSGTISHFAVFSAASSGTQLTDWTALTASKTVASGDELTVAVGAISITLD